MRSCSRLARRRIGGRAVPAAAAGLQPPRLPGTLLQQCKQRCRPAEPQRQHQQRERQPELLLEPATGRHPQVGLAEGWRGSAGLHSRRSGRAAARLCLLSSLPLATPTTPGLPSPQAAAAAPAGQAPVGVCMQRSHACTVRVGAVSTWQPVLNHRTAICPAFSTPRLCDPCICFVRLTFSVCCDGHVASVHGTPSVTWHLSWCRLYRSAVHAGRARPQPPRRARLAGASPPLPPSSSSSSPANSSA